MQSLRRKYRNRPDRPSSVALPAMFAIAVATIFAGSGCASAKRRATGSKAVSASLLGYWATGCSRLPQKKSAVVKIQFSESTLASSIEVFEDEACKQPGMTIHYAGTFALATPIGETFGIDFMATAVSLTVNGDRSVLANNQRGACGINDWVPAVPREVSGRFCDPFRIPRIAQKIADLYSIRDGKMWFGAFPRLPKRNDSRPTALNPEFKFTKTSFEPIPVPMGKISPI